jgi:hypothetical protein
MVWRYQRTALSVWKVGEMNEWRICRGIASVTPMYHLNGENYYFPLLRLRELINLSSSNDYFMLYTNCIGYLLKYLQWIFDANPATWSVCLRETGKERTNVKYVPKHPLKCNLKLTNFKVTIPLCAIFLYSETNFCVLKATCFDPLRSGSGKIHVTHLIVRVHCFLWVLRSEPKNLLHYYVMC